MRNAKPKNVSFKPQVSLVDTLLNLVSGMGMSHDKNTHNMFAGTSLSQPELEAAYRFDWIARKVVDLPAVDMVREGRNWQAKKDVIEAVELEEKRLNYWGNLLKAMKLARLDGGSAIIIGGPGRMDEPLAPKDVTRGSLKFLWAVRRYDLNLVEREYDLYSPYFGQAKMFELMNYGIKRPRIHPSRVMIFKGNETPDGKDDTGGIWGDSVLQVVNDAVVNAGVAQAGIAGLIHEAKIDVIAIPNLMENLSSEETTSALMKRFTLASMAKSNNNTLLLDTEEKWERKQINFTQLPDVLKLYLQVTAAAADIPATRLCGLSPQGLNATGDTEERMYYDRLAGERKLWLVPKLDILDEMVMRSARGSNPKSTFYQWAPMWQMTAKELSEISKSKADTVKIIKDTGLIPDEVLQAAQANQLIEDSQFPGFEDAYEASTEAEKAAKLKETQTTTEGEGTQPSPTGASANTQNGITEQGETE